MTEYAQSFYRNERLNLFIMDNTHIDTRTANNDNDSNRKTEEAKK